MTKKLIPIAITAAVLTHYFVMAQMPDWIGIKDKDGNKYFIDGTGKVRTLGEPLKKYRAVSASGIEYYIQHGEDLVKYHHKLEGLIMLKSILAMPVESFMVQQAQRKASKIINALALRDGTRFGKLSREASILMYRSGKSTTVMDDYMRFSVTVSGTVEVIRKKAKSSGAYEYQGITLGLKFDENAGGTSSYDSIMAIDAEKYLADVGSIDEIVGHWELAAGQGDITRTVLTKNDKKVVSEFLMSGSVPLRGLEGLFMSGKRAYFIKIIASSDGYSGFRDMIKTAMDSFTVVSQ